MAKDGLDMLNPIYYIKATLVCMVGCNATLRCFGSLFFTLGNYIRHLVSTTVLHLPPQG